MGFYVCTDILVWQAVHAMYCMYFLSNSWLMCGGWIQTFSSFAELQCRKGIYNDLCGIKWKQSKKVRLAYIFIFWYMYVCMYVHMYIETYTLCVCIVVSSFLYFLSCLCKHFGSNPAHWGYVCKVLILQKSHSNFSAASKGFFHPEQKTIL